MTFETFFFGLQITASIGTLGVIIYAYRSFSGRSATLLSLALLGFLQYDLSYLPDSQITEWVRHLPVYMAMILLFAFINSFSRPIAKTSFLKNASWVAVPVVTTTSGAVLVDWLRLMTDTGLQHILVLPLFAGLFIASAIRSAQSDDEIDKPLRWFMAAGSFYALIHVMEFVVESQGLIPAIVGNPVEVLELVWIFMALACMVCGIYAARRMTTAPAPTSAL